MRRTKLGSQGLETSCLGLGCMAMSEFYGAADLDASRATLHRSLELGLDFLDTADMYGSGHNEEFLAPFLAERRSEVVLATKFGIRRGDDGAFLGVSGRPEYVAEACDASLRRLGVETIDLYYQHRVDPEVPIEDTVGAMARLVEAGKVRFLGLSEAGAGTIRRAHAVHPITAVQTEYSLWTRDPEESVLAACRDLGVGFVAYSPLGRGFLTGKIRSLDDLAEDDWRRANPRFLGENLARNLKLVEEVERIAGERKATAAQVALAWLLAKGEDVIPLFGTRSSHRLDENAGAAELQLQPGDLERLDDLAPASGTRYPETGMRAIDT